MNIWGLHGEYGPLVESNILSYPIVLMTKTFDEMSESEYDLKFYLKMTSYARNIITINVEKLTNLGRSGISFESILANPNPDQCRSLNFIV